MPEIETTTETTALLVPLPRAGRAIDDLRRLDPASGFGVPAHVTVLFPFAPIPQIDRPMRDRLRQLFGAHRRFEVEFRETAWFGDRVLWLAPVDAAPFLALTRDVIAAFPAWPPYEGAFDEVIPHLTIGDASASPADAETTARLLAAEAAATDRLPLHDLADRVLLMAGRREEATWWTVEEFPLA